MRRIFFVVISALFLFSPLNGQEVWDLKKCVDHAMTNNINVQQAKLNVDFAQVNLTLAKHSRYPNLNAGSGANWNFGRTVDPTSNTFNTETFFANNINLSTGVTLYNGGRINKTIKQSKLDLAAAELDADQSTKDISLTVANTYLNVLFAQENLKIAQNQLELTQEQLSQLDKLIRAGSRPQNERLDLEAQTALQEQNIVQTENTYDIALLNLKQLLRLDVEKEIQVIVPSAGIDVLMDPDQITFEQVYSSALKTQSNIAGQEYKNESAALGVQIAKTGYYPNLSFGGSLGTNYSNKGLKVDDVVFERVNQTVYINGTATEIGTDQPSFITSQNPYSSQIDENLSYGFGLQLSIPIYNNYSNKMGVERAKLNAANTMMNGDQMRDNLKTNVMQSIANVKAAKKQMEASQKSVEAQRAAYANAQKRFDLGAINTFDFINAKNQLDNAEINLIISRYDYVFKSKVIDFYLGNPLSLN